MIKFDTEHVDEKPFYTGNLRDDLADWLRKIKALTGILSVLLWHENKDGGQVDFSDLEVCCSIIEDYAKATDRAIEDNCRTLFCTDAALEDSIRRKREIVEKVKNNQHAPDIGIINRSLLDLKQLTERMVPAYQLMGDLEALKRQIQTKTTALPRTK